MLGLGWPTLQHQKGPEPSSSLHRESAKAAAGEDNHWRSSSRQAIRRKQKGLRGNERPAQGDSTECCHSRSPHSTPGHEERALGVAGGRKRTRSHRRDNEDHGPRNGSRRLGAPTLPSRSGARQHQRTTAVSLQEATPKQASLLAELGHREHLGYSARQSEELRCLLSHDKRERISSPTREMTMEQSTCRVTDERRYARH
jgi:hypothetical protein